MKGIFQQLKAFRPHASMMYRVRSALVAYAFDFPSSRPEITRIELIVVIWRKGIFCGMSSRLKFLLITALTLSFGHVLVSAQQPVIVQPGAPGKATRQLPASTRAELPPTSQKDIEFMQGMIMHHAQAVEMTDMIEARTKTPEIRLLGEKISKSQSDEMVFMRRWLQLRGQATEMKMAMPSESHAHGSHSTPNHQMLMPGMLTSKQMQELLESSGDDFDRLFLTGMIQHHGGALVMVEDLFDNPGTGQDAELFNFASDVDTGQKGEIKIMQNLLSRLHVKKKS
jgi:uncharacterized protein (DUF305 family)